MSIPWELAVGYALGLTALYFVSKLLIVPERLLWRLMLNGLLGGLAMWLINLLTPYTGFSIVINPLTLLVSGLLGLPGVGLVALLRLVLP